MRSFVFYVARIRKGNTVMKRNFKKILSGLLLLVMIMPAAMVMPLTAGAAEGEIAAVAPSGAGTESNPYLLSDPAHLVWMGQQDPLPGGYYAMTEDIDMAGVTNFNSWQTADGDSVCFDGNEFAIKNLTVTDGHADSAWVGGLFGISCGNDTIRNLKLESLTVDNTWSGTNNTMIGGLVGKVAGASLTIENVTVDENSTVKSQYTSANNYTGGFVGRVHGATTVVTIKDCVNDAVVDGYRYNGYCHAGGFVGSYESNSALTFENCTRGGNTQARRAGGFLGISTSANAYAFTFRDCVLNGDVICNSNDMEAGGLIGRVDTVSATEIVAVNCVVEGNISGSSSATNTKMGGFFGYLNGIGTIAMTNCVNKASVKSRGVAGGFAGCIDNLSGDIAMNHCVNAGVIGQANNTVAAQTAGGFIGRITNPTEKFYTVKMAYCVNEGKVRAAHTAAGLVGTTAENVDKRAALHFDFDYCANTGALETISATAGTNAGENGMGGLIGVLMSHQAKATFEADHCYNIGSMTMSTAVVSDGGVGGLVGYFGYQESANTVAFRACLVNSAISTAYTQATPFYGAVAPDNQTVVVDEACQSGDGTAEGIAAINGAIAAPYVATEGNLSIRLKVSDDFGFMAILHTSALMQSEVEAQGYGFCFATAPFDEIEDADKIVDAQGYEWQADRVYATYEELTAATLDQTVYFAAYATVGDVRYMSEVRAINCLEMVEDLQDGKVGPLTITTNEYEMALYTAMISYHAAFRDYYDNDPTPVILRPKLTPDGVLTSLPAIYAKQTKKINTGNNATVAIFANATVADFEEYCSAYKKARYTEYAKTTFHGEGAMPYIGEELYVGDTKYFDYFDLNFDKNYKSENYFATYISDDYSIDLAFHQYDDFMYVSISPRAGLTLPNNQAVEVENPLPIMVTQVGTAEFHVGDAAACYVIRLADGSFIVYDTAFGTYNGGEVAEEIYKILRKQAPDPENIVIAAFMLSHPHLDHIGGFTQFANRYASNTGIKVKQVVYNFPDLTVVPNTSGVGNSENLHVTNTNAAVKKFGTDVEIVKPRSGNVLHYPGVKFNVLYTQEDFLSLVSNADGSGNAMTMVTQMVTNDGTKVLFGGDHTVNQTKGQLKYRYGTFLESYVCTLFHHGIGGGADNTTYEKVVIYKMAIKPKIALWPLTWAKMSATNSSSTKYFSDSVWNKYITAGKRWGKDGSPGTGGFEEGKIHSSPNTNGVYGWFVSDDGIQILTFNGTNNVSVTTYATRADYYNS